MRIKQCIYDKNRMSKFYSFLEDNRLSGYKSSKDPVIFFGLYSRAQFRALRDHKGLVIIIWRGTDILKHKRLSDVIALRKNSIRHVAISSFIAKDLDKVGISYKFIPIPGVKINNISAEKLGDEIYAYFSKKRVSFYGGDIINRIKNKVPFKFNISTGSNDYTRDEILKLYNRSFIGLRLTEHDGIANQVIELGLMGRRCIHNGDQPNCIHWKTDEDIIESIMNESKKIGQNNLEIAKKVKDYMNIGRDWLDTEYWK